MKFFFASCLSLLFFFSCKKSEHDYTLKMYFLKTKPGDPPLVEWRSTTFNAPNDSLAYEYGLQQYMKEGHKRDIINGQPAKFEVLNYKDKLVQIKHGFY